MNWDDLKYFNALYLCKTVTSAANTLQVNYVTVSRRIERLEQYLNQKLFIRTPDGYIATPEGRLLYNKTVRISEELTSLKNYFSSNNGFKKNVIISTIPFLAENIIIPNLDRVLNKFPEVRIEIDQNNRNINISKKEADIASRLNIPKAGDFLCKKIGGIDFCLYGARKWFEMLDAGKPIATISYTHKLEHLEEFTYMVGMFGTSSIRIQTDYIKSQKIAADQGYGIALLPRLLVKETDDFACRDPERPIFRKIWMLTAKTISQLTSVKVVAKELVAIFENL